MKEPDEIIPDENTFGYMLGKLKLSRHFAAAYREEPRAGLTQIRKRITQRRTVKIRRRLSVAAGILLLIGGYFWMSQYRPAGEPAALLTEGYEIGQVYLKLSSGENISLKERQGVLLSDPANKITVTDNTLSYASGKDSTASTEYYTVVVTPGAEFHVVLEDGSKVWLNAGSEFRFPATFATGHRSVEITGEAFFEVAPDAGRPFRVKAGPLESVVLGTAFNVRNYPEQNSVAVTLASGKLEVAAPDKVHTLQPGIQVAYDRTTGTSSAEEVEIERYLSWKDGYYYFNKTPLQEIMTTLALWYNVEVVYKDPEVKGILFSGQLKKYESISVLFKHFEYSNENIQFSQEANTIIISRK